MAEDYKRKRKAIVACKAILWFWSQEFALQAAKWKVCEKALAPAAHVQCSHPKQPIIYSQSQGGMSKACDNTQGSKGVRTVVRAGGPSTGHQSQ